MRRYTWVLTGTRLMFADQRTARRSVRQTVALVSGEKLLVSNTIYISNRFSCKLHASTLTKTKDRTINYRQIQVH